MGKKTVLDEPISSPDLFKRLMNPFLHRLTSTHSTAGPFNAAADIQT